VSSSRRPAKKPSRAPSQPSKAAAKRTPAKRAAAKTPAKRAAAKAPPKRGRAKAAVKRPAAKAPAKRGAERAPATRGAAKAAARRVAAKTPISRAAAGSTPRRAPKAAQAVPAPAERSPVVAAEPPPSRPATPIPRPGIRLAGSATSRLTIKPGPQGPTPKLELSTKVRPGGLRPLSEVELDEDEVLIDPFDASLGGVHVRVTAVLERTCVYVDRTGERRLASKKDLVVEADKLPIRRRGIG
jgi:hypothetical protein